MTPGKKKSSSKKSTPKAVEKTKSSVTASKAVKAVAKKVAKKVTQKSATKKSESPAGALDSMVGKKAPAFRLQDQSDKTVSSSSLKGKPYVLYFYPKDNTPGCTTESCDFRDAFGNFSKSKVTVLGVSPDSTKSHSGFAAKYELPFTLLSDPEKTLAQAYGVWALKKNYGREYWGIVRSTFLVGANGKVLKAWRQVRVPGHVEAVLAEAQAQ